MTSLKPIPCGFRLNGKTTEVNAGPVVSQENIAYCMSRQQLSCSVSQMFPVDDGQQIGIGC